MDDMAREDLSFGTRVIAMGLGVLLLATGASAQSIQEIDGHHYQLSLMGLQQREAPAATDESRVAVVVASRTVVQHYQRAPQQMQQLRQRLSGGGGCGCRF